MPINGINPVERMPRPESAPSSPELETRDNPESTPEKSFDSRVENTPSVSHQATNIPTPTSTPVDDFEIDKKYKDIESILEEDLGDIYFNMDAKTQQEFKIKGEETTLKIIALMNKPKLQVKKVISLIRDWLKIVPGINKFFLEQSVKIKTDKIVEKNKSF